MILEELKEKLTPFIHRGDTICIFSDITSFGFPPSLKEQIKKNGPIIIMDSYIDTLKEIVGPTGLIILPTFTYSATKKEIYDPDKTPSTVGALTEHFRKQNDVKRSLHPIFSFAAWGTEAEKFLQLENYNCFGEGSIFQKLYDRNATYLLFGVDMQHGATYIYFSEEKLNVPYRYPKQFTGKIKNNNQETEITFSYFVRKLEIPYNDSRDRLQLESLQRNISHAVTFNGGTIIITESQPIHALIKEKLALNPNYLIQKVTA